MELWFLNESSWKETEPLSPLNSFLDSLSLLPDPLIYLILGLSAFVENVFPPIPGDTITAFGAFLVGTKRLDFLGVHLSTTLGSLAGFMFLFRVGSFVGKRFLVEKDYRFFKARDIKRAEEWFRKYGYGIILANRFLPGLRSVISLAGGISGLSVFKVAMLALLSSSAWNLLWMIFGYTLGSNWDTVKGKMTYIMVHYNIAVLSILGLVSLIFVVWWAIKK